MKSLAFPLPAIVAALAAVATFPFSLAAGGTLAFTAALGCIIHTDYCERYRSVRLPRLAAARVAATTTVLSAKGSERHPLAA